MKGAISTYLSIIIQNVNGLHPPVKRYSLAKWIQSNIQLFSVFKKLASLAKRKDEKSYYKQTEFKSKQE
jgi:hypothetical protein